MSAVWDRCDSGAVLLKRILRPDAVPILLSACPTVPLPLRASVAQESHSLHIRGAGQKVLGLPSGRGDGERREEQGAERWRGIMCEIHTSLELRECVSMACY